MRRGLALAWPAQARAFIFPTSMVKTFSIFISGVVGVGMIAGAIADYRALRLEAQAGIPVPECANISLLRPPCR